MTSDTTLRWTAVAAALALSTGCATVKMSRVRPDYDATDRNTVKRLTVVVQPLPLGDAKVGELWSLVARRYVNQKRQFIVKDNKAVAAGPDGAAFDPKGACGEGLDGVLWLQPDVKAKEGGEEAAVNGKLLRCTDLQEVWAAEAGGSWKAEDKNLEQVAEHYGTELGQEVRPHVAPAMNLLRPLLDTLPDPVLTESDKDEKAIEE